ncbi:MAG TPA: hypothetical protein VN083_06430 [Vicinamibacteria bacterium]|jgi:hypothetical protein|nr:hypothetical protein [Vicinamibacteria bacterium]
MPLRIDLDSAGRTAETLQEELKRLHAPKGELWVVSVRPYEDEEGWLVLMTGGAEKEDLGPDWSFLAVEELKNERICTYAQVFGGEAGSSGGLVRAVAAFLRAPSRVMAPAKPRGRG